MRPIDEDYRTRAPSQKVMCEGQEYERPVPSEMGIPDQTVHALDAVFGIGGARQVPAHRRRDQPFTTNDPVDHLHHCCDPPLMHDGAAALENLTYHRCDAHPVTP
jgi:hypothetical protein